MICEQNRNGAADSIMSRLEHSRPGERWGKTGKMSALDRADDKWMTSRMVWPQRAATEARTRPAVERLTRKTTHTPRDDITILSLTITQCRFFFITHLEYFTFI